MIKTRKQYMNNEIEHTEYYLQCVTDLARTYVLNAIGKKRILNSTCEHLNTIPLKLWDRLNVQQYIDRDIWREMTGHKDKKSYIWSSSDNVCISKAIANEFKRSK